MNGGLHSHIEEGVEGRGEGPRPSLPSLAICGIAVVTIQCLANIYRPVTKALSSMVIIEVLPPVPAAAQINNFHSVGQRRADMQVQLGVRVSVLSASHCSFPEMTVRTPQ